MLCELQGWVDQIENLPNFPSYSSKQNVRSDLFFCGVNAECQQPTSQQFIHFGNPKEHDTHLCLRFFQNNLVNPKIALTNLLKYMTPKIITKPPKVCDTHIK